MQIDVETVQQWTKDLHTVVEQLSNSIEDMLVRNEFIKILILMQRLQNRVPSQEITYTLCVSRLTNIHKELIKYVDCPELIYWTKRLKL